MAKNVLQSTILSANGSVAIAPGARIEVRNPAGQLVPLWLDRDGTQPTSNPFTADSNGFFRVYLDAGRYHITASKDGQSQEWRDVLLGSAVGYDVGTEPDQVPTNALLGSAAGYDVTTSPTDTTPGRVLTVGSLGLGKPTADPATPITGSLLSGAMLAAGAIVEMGENANGSYWRWESGLQVCAATNITTGMMAAGETVKIPFPAAFSNGRAATSWSMSDQLTASGRNNAYAFAPSGTANENLSNQWVFRNCSSVSFELRINLLAVGRWK